MKKSLIITILSLWAVAGAMAQNGEYVDDLYRGSTKKSRQSEAAAKSSAKVSSRSQKQSQQMPVSWTPGRTSSGTASAVSTQPASDKAELVTSYDEALQRRLDAYKNYKELDDSYWQLMESYHTMLSNKYDPDLYNIIVFGNEMWVEPVYISALFDGSDPAAGVCSKEFTAKSNTNVNISLNVGPGWWWDNPWDYYWYGPWRTPWYWGYYGGWYGPYWGWGPSWEWGPGWGPVGPGYYPPPQGGGGRPNYGRPVIWGNNPGWGPAPGNRPDGSPGRPAYTGGYRRNENGTGVPIDNGSGSVNRRPGGTGVSIRPGSTGNQYSPASTSRPTVGGNSGKTPSQSVDRSYRRDRTSAPRRETPTRSEPSYSSPSRGSFGSGGSVGGGGGFRRR